MNVGIAFSGGDAAACTGWRFSEMNHDCLLSSVIRPQNSPDHSK
jgi:hypothetical protein